MLKRTFFPWNHFHISEASKPIQSLVSQQDNQADLHSSQYEKYQDNPYAFRRMNLQYKDLENLKIQVFK